jgi:hypothetical protein
MHAFGRHFKSIAASKKVSHMKFVHDLQALGIQKGRLTTSPVDEITRCPCCLTALETQSHLLCCKANPAHDKAIQTFCKQLKKRDGNRFGTVFADIVEQWLADPTIIPCPQHCRNPEAIAFGLRSVTYC